MAGKTSLRGGCVATRREVYSSRRGHLLSYLVFSRVSVFSWTPSDCKKILMFYVTTERWQLGRSCWRLSVLSCFDCVHCVFVALMLRFHSAVQTQRRREETVFTKYFPRYTACQCVGATLFNVQKRHAIAWKSDIIHDDGDVTASSKRWWSKRCYGTPTALCRDHTEFLLAIVCALAAFSLRALCLKSQRSHNAIESQTQCREHRIQSPCKFHIHKTAFARRALCAPRSSCDGVG